MIVWPRMPRGLERRYGLDHHHFVTFSCYRRQPFLAEAPAREIFERSLEAMRVRYGFSVDAYVVMPEHVHLLVSEPKRATLSVALQALKISVARRLPQRPFWQRRFHDFNVFTDTKRIEKRQYIHRNPFKRCLVAHPKDWTWSSYRHWAYGEQGAVAVESTWTYAEQLSAETAETSCNPTSPHPS
jgi:putative transposase